MAETDTNKAALDTEQGMSSGPGAMLREARLREKMTIEQVAEALYLSRDVIEQVEQNDFNALPPLTFVRGYVKSYAGLLGLDETPLLARLDHLDQGPQSPLVGSLGKLESMGRAKPKPVSRSPGLLGVAIVLAVLLVGVAAATWWLTRDQAPSADPTADPAASSEATEQPARSSTPVDESADALARTPTAIEPPALTDSATASNSVDNARNESSNEASDNAPAASAAESTPDKPAISDMAASATESINPELASRLRELNLEFSGDSWMEVSDARGERLMFDMMRAGDNTLRGVPPFEIVVGNIQHVLLTYQGQVVDLEAHARGDVARLTLGDS